MTRQSAQPKAPEMTDPIDVYGFETSNNMKVRVALGYKGIAYRFHSIEPSQREAIIKLSGQYLTPVLHHGNRVLSDSAAILRYLDSEFRDTPRLFGDSLAEQWEIENWELFGRAELAGPMLKVVHTRVNGGTLDQEQLESCNCDFSAAVDKLAAGIRNREWLIGQSMTAADITAAAVMTRVRGASLFDLPASAKELEAWEARVMHFDGPMRQA